MSKKKKNNEENVELVYHKKLIRRRKPNRSIAGDIVLFLFLTLVALIMFFPIIFAVSNALKPLDELFRFPPKILPQNPTFDNFSDLFVTMGKSWVSFSRYLFNTVFITFVGTAGHLLIASMGAFVLAKYDFPGGKTFFRLVTVAMMFTGMVTQIPNYLILNKLGWIDTYWSIIIPAFASPMGLFLMRQFMGQIPDSMIEAAKLDGASHIRICWQVVMPNVKPAWLTLMIECFKSLWNTGSSIYIHSEELKTFNYAIQQILSGGIARSGAGAASTVVMMMVPIIVFILNQSQIIETMGSSGMKD